MYKILTSRTFLILFGAIVVSTLGYTFVTSWSTFGPSHRYLSISTLDSDMMAENYFPTDTRTIRSGDNIAWNVNVLNQMEKTEYLLIKIKLLNATDQNPDDVPDSPSPAPSLIEFDHLVPNNSTWVIPLDWSVQEAVRESQYIGIRSLMINGAVVDDLDIRSIDGRNFRMVIELWRYDPQAGEFAFAWNDGTETKSMWNQLWFDLRINN